MSQQPPADITSPSKSTKFSAEIFLPLGNLRLKSNTSNQSPLIPKKQESEEEEELERSYSPSKYFGKRPSFEFKNLRNIEKPMLNRQFSEFKLKDPRQLEVERKASKEAENYKVKFKGEEIIENEAVDSMLDSKTLEKKKAGKPILKKAHFTDEVPIEKCFDPVIHAELIQEAVAESTEKKKEVRELLAKYFVEGWKKCENVEQKAIRFLQVKL